MLLGNDEIKSLVDTGVIKGADINNIGPAAYDLTTDSFFRARGESMGVVSLEPGQSVFAGSKEIIELPSNVAAHVTIRNSRLRQGLSLDAPLYFPGHKTRVFFRVTNVSSSTITLEKEHAIAAISFEEVDGCTKPYVGAFSDEFNFSGMGDYKSVYEAQMQEIEEKKSEVKDIEKKMYGSVISLMAVFVAVFSLINVNTVAALSGSSLPFFLVINLATVGSFAFLAGLITLIIDTRRCAVIAAWAACVIAFVAAIAVVFCTGCL